MYSSYLIINHPSGYEHSLTRHHALWQIQRGDAQESVRVTEMGMDRKGPPKVWLQRLWAARAARAAR